MGELSYLFYTAASGFVALLDLMLVSVLWLSYRAANRDYLKVACFAGILEIIRPGLDLIAGLNGATGSWYLLSIVFQFGSTLLFIAALLLIYETVTRTYYVLFSILGVSLLGVLVYQSIYADLDTLTYWYISAAPIISLSILLLWRAIRTGTEISSAKIILVLSGLVILAIRSILPSLNYGEFYLLFYFMEYLSFSMMLVGLVLFELEFSKQQVSDLLSERTQSEKDLQFIVDNSLDVILVADHVGLLQSWSAKAREIFGYTPEQAVGKIHMDDLFVSNNWGQGMSEDDEVQAKMESVDGKSFLVDVRTREVTDAGRMYRLFVLRLVEEPKLSS